MKNKEYKVLKRRGRVFNFFKSLVKKFKRQPEIVNLNEGGVLAWGIFVANHSGASGPFTYELFFPHYFIPWGTHEMCGNYKMRWNYLYHVFYRQKLKYGRVKSFLLATSFGAVSKIFYNATGLIGTYKDARLKRTYEKSFKVLNNDISLLIFPENSNSGYHDKPRQYFGGFVSLSKMYYKRTSIDLPVYNVYYSKENNQIVIDKPLKVNEMLNNGLNEDEVAQVFLKNLHNLFENFANKKTNLN